MGVKCIRFIWKKILTILPELQKKNNSPSACLFRTFASLSYKMSFSMSEGVKTKVRINKRCGCVPLPVDKMCQQGIPKQITLDRTVQISWNGGVVCPIQYFTMIRTINNKFATAPFWCLKLMFCRRFLSIKFLFIIFRCAKKA